MMGTYRTHQNRVLTLRNLQNSLESQRFEDLHMEKKSLHMAELGLLGAKLGLH